MAFELPSRAQAGYLDPEISGEGMKVILSDGDQVSWSPPPVKLVIPDISGVKSVRKYFNRTGYQVFPAWLYHPSDDPRLVKNADEAAQLGVCFRDATPDEKSRYGLKNVWDWKDDSQWRPQAWSVAKFDPSKPGTGKTYQAAPINPHRAQSDLLEALIPSVTAAVAQVLLQNGTGKPASVDPKQWDEFIKFQAWQKAQAALSTVDIVASQETVEEGDDDPIATNALAETNPADELKAWQQEAADKGIKVDGRWSLARLKEEVQKAA